MLQTIAEKYNNVAEWSKKVETPSNCCRISRCIQLKSFKRNFSQKTRAGKTRQNVRGTQRLFSVEYLFGEAIIA